MEAGSYQMEKKGTEHKQSRRQMASKGETVRQPLCKCLELLRDNKRQKATCLLLYPVREAVVPDLKALTDQSQNNQIVKNGQRHQCHMNNTSVVILPSKVCFLDTQDAY